MDKNISSNGPNEEPETVFVPGLSGTMSLTEVLAEIEAASPAKPTPSTNTAPAPNWRKTGLYSVKLLEEINQNESPWIVENLIREGDQVVLSGPPKSGKTILALQLAMDVGLGNPYFLIPDRYKIPEKKRVLFLSLEMRQRAMSRRVKQQWRRTTDYPELQFMFKVLGSDSHMMFQLGGEADGLESTKVANDLHELIKTANPKLIILDSLIQIHALDENSNMRMGMLMRNLRKIFSLVTPSTEEEYKKDLADEVEKKPIKEEILPDHPDGKTTYRVIGYDYIRRTPIAHVLLHHTRKAAEGMGKSFASPDAIRGASSIHSEADLALTLANSGVNRIGINKSARALAREYTEYFEIKPEENGKPLHLAPAPSEDRMRKQVLAQIYQGLLKTKMVFTETIRSKLKHLKLLNIITKGKPKTGFQDEFITKLADANLNTQASITGDKIALAEDTTLAQFFTAFGLDTTDIQDYADATPIAFELASETISKSISSELTSPLPKTAPIEVKAPRKRGRPPGSKNKNKK